MTFVDFLQTPLGIVAGLVSVIVAGLLIAFGAKTFSGNKELPPAPHKPQITAPEETSLSDDTEQPQDTETPADAEASVETQLADGGLVQQDSLVDETSHEADAPELAQEEPSAEPELDTPESLPSRMERLRGRLARSGSLGKALLSVLSRGELSAADWEELEDTLLMADLGLEATDELMEALRTRVKVSGTQNAEDVKSYLREELLTLVGPDMDRSLNLDAHTTAEGSKAPATILMVGVNGTGKTTTVGKMSRILVAEGRTVVLGAADTFRAAAADQLTTWGERVGVEVVRSDREGADPASVAFDAVKTGMEKNADVVLVDTAGRLQNKSTLMEELGKIKRVMERQAPTNEVLLVLDATTGQNGMRQAEVFAEAVGVTGIVLTKLDGSAKGGIVVSVQRALGVPVKFVGLGEGVDDLAPFDPHSFVDAIVNA